jgi:hypothetical protein
MARGSGGMGGLLVALRVGVGERSVSSKMGVLALSVCGAPVGSALQRSTGSPRTIIMDFCAPPPL